MCLLAEAETVENSLVEWLVGLPSGSEDFVIDVVPLVRVNVGPLLVLVRLSQLDVNRSDILREARRKQRHLRFPLWFR